MTRNVKVDVHPDASGYSQAVGAFSLIGIRSEPEINRAVSRLRSCVHNVGLPAKHVKYAVKCDQMRRFAIRTNFMNYSCFAVHCESVRH